MAKVEIIPANLRDTSWIAAHMRAQDFAEIDAVTDAREAIGLSVALLSGSVLKSVALLGDQPVAVFGVAMMFPHVGSAWAFGTNKMRRAIPAMSRYVRDVWRPTLLDFGYVRVEVRTMAEHDLSHKWLAGLGARLETPEPFVYGRHGERFVQYAFSAET